MMKGGNAIPWAVIAAAWEEAGRLGLCETKAKTDQGETSWVLGGESVFCLSLSPCNIPYPWEQADADLRGFPAELSKTCI